MINRQCLHTIVFAALFTAATAVSLALKVMFPAQSYK